MKHTLASSAALLFFCAGAVASAQTQEGQEVIPAPHVRIELTLDKKVYGRREPVTYKAVLKNVDPRGFYISKSFHEGGGGIAGFYVYGTQLSGKRGGVNCSAMAADDYCRLAHVSLTVSTYLRSSASGSGCAMTGKPMTTIFAPRRIARAPSSALKVAAPTGRLRRLRGKISTVHNQQSGRIRDLG